MDAKLRTILEAMLKMSIALNGELVRLTRTDQFSENPECVQLIENLRSNYTESLQNLYTLERRIHASGLTPPKE
jgi:hypothetical protein